MERALYINKYRNIGITDTQRFVLNNYDSKETIGNLVIVVGPNNSGKSNVLDALESFGKKSINKRDVTSLSYEKENAVPQLSLSCKDNREFTYRITHGQPEPFVVCESKIGETFLKTEKDFEELVDCLTILSSFLSDAEKKYGYTNNSNKMNNELQHICMEINTVNDNIQNQNAESLGKIKSHVSAFAKELMECKRCDSICSEAWKEFVGDGTNHRRFIDFCLNNDITPARRLSTYYSSELGMEFMPQIIRYKDNEINDEQFHSQIGNISSNTFFNSLFRAIDYSIDTLQKAYAAFNDQTNKGILIKQEEDINSKLVEVADKFNSLYYAGERRYKFAISLESNAVYFYMNKGDNPITLKYQSVGFKWFFDLYFNLLCGKELKRGDIIIMDEPATNLHVQGQRELRKFLKDFAIENGITIVLATHSPFLIDVDYLDELRVIETNDGEAFIHNDFSAINPDDTDSLKPIKTALTVDGCHIYDPDKKVVFVEGITDYNYLLTFKRLLNVKDDIVFLPINGVGNGKNADIKKHQKAISKSLIGLRKHNPVLLVDGDDVGKSICEVNAKDSDLTVIALSDIDATFKTIESLFDKDDLKKHGLMTDNGKYIKHASVSARIKTYAKKDDFSTITLDNFRKLFDKLLEQV